MWLWIFLSQKYIVIIFMKEIECLEFLQNPPGKKGV